jgi:cysteine desulfurase
MLVNNETGVIQPIKVIAELAHSQGAFFMTDATQAIGKMPVDVSEMGIDLMAFSGHKFYGPKGVGGLYVRGRRPNKVKLEALIHGGGHERAMRSGTLNVPGIVGLGKAAELALQDMEANRQQIGTLRDELEQELLKIPDSFVNGSQEKRLYNVTNICFKGADADAVMIGLQNVMVSDGSACTSASIEPSHVLLGMKLNRGDAKSSLRFSLSQYNSQQEVREVSEKVNKVVARMRAMAM